MKWLQFFRPADAMDTGQTKAYIAEHDSDTYTLLDVRQNKEYERSHIPGAVLIPLPELSDRLDEISKEKPLLVYCAVGGRSRVAAQMLAGKGFQKVFNVSGGIKAWEGKTAIGPQTLGMDLFSGKEDPEDVLKVAYSLEQGLRDFYLNMAEKASKEPVRALFEKLSEIEVKHQISIYQTWCDMAGTDTSQDDFEQMVEEKATEGGLTGEEYLELFQPDLDSEVDVISLAMSIEAQALDLYHRVSEQIKDEKSRLAVLKIADEEKMHLKSLGTLMETL